MYKEYKRLAKGTLTDTDSVIYTVPAGTIALPTGISICNKSEDDVNISLIIADTAIISEHKIKAHDNLTIPYKESNIIIEAEETIKAKASVAGAVDIYISGVEVS